MGLPHVVLVMNGSPTGHLDVLRVRVLDGRRPHEQCARLGVLRQADRPVARPARRAGRVARRCEAHRDPVLRRGARIVARVVHVVEPARGLVRNARVLRPVVVGRIVRPENDRRGVDRVEARGIIGAVAARGDQLRKGQQRRLAPAARALDALPWLGGAVLRAHDQTRLGASDPRGIEDLRKVAVQLGREDGGLDKLGDAHVDR
eukprot:4534774-Prymnesium_polylepis.1